MEAEPSTHSEIMYPMGIIKRTHYLEEGKITISGEIGG